MSWVYREIDREISVRPSPESYAKSVDGEGVISTLVLSGVNACGFKLVCRAEGLCAELVC